MNYLHPENRNLHIYQRRQFNGAELLRSHHYVEEYLQSIEEVMGQALKAHPRTMLIRFDLHFPFESYSLDCPWILPNDVISKFFSALTAKFEADLNRRARDGKRVRQNGIRFIWCKEQKTSDAPHYHVALFLSSDAYNRLGHKCHLNSIAGKIVNSWASALGFGLYDIIHLVHIPKSKPVYYLNVNSGSFKEEYTEALSRLSYLAKVATKSYGNSGRSFGCSRR